MMTERVQARVFGEVADEYDRIRPGYPAALVDDVVTFARIGVTPALEVGAGTGKATLAFAQRGVTLTAVEPDEAMAAVLARRVRGRTNVTITVSSFEDYAPTQPFGLLFSAQAWHWTDPMVRWQRAAAALAPGGALALFWNNDRPADDRTMDAILQAHRDYAPGIVPVTEPVTEAALAAAWPRTDLDGLSEFGELSERLYCSARTLSSADYVALLATQSAYRMLDDAVRTQLLRVVADRLGEQVSLKIETALYLARRQPD
jgi:SAM-dependent methyltransferase